MASIKKRPDGKWRARYRDADGKEHARHFDYRYAATPGAKDRTPGDSAQEWLDKVTASMVAGTYLDPKMARVTVEEWCATWLRGHASQRPRTVLQARSHVAHIVRAFGSRPLASIRPSEVKAWVAQLKADGFADSTVRALHSRLSQVMSDAVHDGLIPRSPTSRRTAPGAGAQRPYVATTEQVWELYAGMPAGMRPAILLGAFAGLRLREIVALRTSDVDFMRGVITPEIQHPGDPLKTETSRKPIPIPQELALELGRVPAEWGSLTLVVGAIGRPVSPSTLDKAFSKARATVESLPEGFRLHDLRHYYASLLIASGVDVKTVQARMRHASAKTTLDTYGHMWPDKDEATRAVVAGAFTSCADSLRTEAPTSASLRGGE